ncbi:uncharacterized protein [Procambarus clarkii]|uniref:uncharacterized protein n=1 Tax=Procambarus clarkii TaxID=6728 RepID=UPI001E67393F|nr:platelet glycoprotein Ib alpha chain-like [Procambarus clarkii]
MTTGNNPREFVRILKILYKANGLPTFNIPEEVFNAPGSTPTTDPVEDADSTSDDDDSATAMQTSDPVQVPTAHKTLPPMTPTSATVPVTNQDITVNAAVLTDLLSTAKPAPPATSSQATQTPTSPLSTTTTVPPLVCEPSQRPKSAAGPIEASTGKNSSLKIHCIYF